MSLDFETPPTRLTLPEERRVEVRRRLLEEITNSREGRIPFPSRWPSARVAYVGILVAVAAAFFSVGAFMYPTSGSGSVGVDSPGFLPASGWNEVSTGTVPIDQGPTAIAANVPLAAENGPIGTFPTQTLSTLPENGIVFHVVIGNLSDATSDYIPMQLPLQLSDARVTPNWEGQPNSNVPMYQITAKVGNYILEVDIFFGTQQPSGAQLASAQDELNRLEVPSS